MRGNLVLRIYLPGAAFPWKSSGNPDITGKVLAEKLSAVFQGKEPVISGIFFKLDNLSDFAIAVLEEVRKIPPGETETYKGIALKAGFPGAARAVGRVLSQNPFPLVFPCHRVVSVSGPGGYQGGPEMKRFLLETEGKSCRFRKNVLL